MERNCGRQPCVTVGSEFRLGFEVGGVPAVSPGKDRHQLWSTRPGIELAPVCVSPSTWSIVNVEGYEATETSGDRKSVGSTRMAPDFKFTTHQIASPKGAFVMLTDGITDVMSPEEKPIAFGLIASENLHQAKERVSPKKLNKGREIAQSLVEMLR